MDLNQRNIKAVSRKLLRELSPKPVLVTLVFIAANLVINWAGSKAAGTAYILNLDVIYSGGPLEDAFIFTPEYINKFGTVIDAVLRLIFSVVGAGYTIYIFSISRRLEAGYGTLLDGFNIFLRVIWMNILQGLMIFLMSLLLFIPGIIFAFGYRQAFYLMLDHPDWSVARCLRESRILMRGHKWELFVFDLSFLGWIILSAFCPPAMIFIRPFMELSRAEYYNRLIGVSVLPNETAPSSDVF